MTLLSPAKFALKWKNASKNINQQVWARYIS